MAVSTPKYYGNSLRDLDQRYRIILSEFTESYPEAKTYPDITEYTDSLQVDELATSPIPISRKVLFLTANGKLLAYK